MSSSQLTADTGTDASDFSQINTCGTSVAPDASCTIKVTFTPTQIGPRTASLTIIDDAPGSPRSVSLSGTGVTSGPNVTLSTNSLTFALQLVGTTAAQPVTLINYGAASLSITSITPSDDFAESNNCGSSLAAGASCTISVAFTPSARGPRTGMLSVAANAHGSPQILSLTGTGTVVELSQLVLNCKHNPLLWECSGPITLTNVGPGALSITSIELELPHPYSPWSESNNCGSSVGAGKSCTITVGWGGQLPCTSTNCVITLVISDDGGGSPQEVLLNPKSWLLIAQSAGCKDLGSGHSSFNSTVAVSDNGGSSPQTVPLSARVY